MSVKTQMVQTASSFGSIMAKYPDPSLSMSPTFSRFSKSHSQLSSRSKRRNLGFGTDKARRKRCNRIKEAGPPSRRAACCNSISYCEVKDFNNASKCFHVIGNSFFTPSPFDGQARGWSSSFSPTRYFICFEQALLFVLLAARKKAARKMEIKDPENLRIPLYRPGRNQRPERVDLLLVSAAQRLRKGKWAMSPEMRYHSES